MPAPAPQPAPVAPAPVAPQPLPQEPSPVRENVVMPPGLEQIDDEPPCFDEPGAAMGDFDVNTARQVTPQDWDAILGAAIEASPITGSMVGGTMFIADDDGLLTIAIHPDDVNTRDALLGESFSALISEQAMARCGKSVNLRVVNDAAVQPPTPVEILPPPNFEEMMPAPAPKAAPREEKKPAPAAEKKDPTPSLKPTEEEFYHDPLIEQALSTFKATLIKN